MELGINIEDYIDRDSTDFIDIPKPHTTFKVYTYKDSKRNAHAYGYISSEGKWYGGFKDWSDLYRCIMAVEFGAALQLHVVKNVKGVN